MGPRKSTDVSALAKEAYLLRTEARRRFSGLHKYNGTPRLLIEMDEVHKLFDQALRVDARAARLRAQ
jgi:hypothetical protein